MKKSNRALQSFAIMLVLLLIGAQGAWADLRRKDNTVCSPKIHFKVPDSWTRAYIVIGGSAHAMPVPDENGWTTVSLDDTKAVGTNSDDAFYINGVNDNTCQLGKCVLPKQFSVKVNDGRAVGFTCATFESGNKNWVDGGEVWIQDHPDIKKSGTTYVTYEEPKVYDFYIFLPNNTVWKSAEPYISETDASGKTKDVKMYNDANNCGWYYRRYIDEPFPASVVVHRDDDTELNEAIGMNGAWEEGAATPIALEGLFEIYSTETGYNKALYFVADAEESQKLPSANQGWYVVRPDVKGKCGYDLAAMIYDTDASLHGAFSCNPDWRDGQSAAEAHANACYTPSAKFQVLSSAAGEMPCIGVTPGMVESTLDAKTKKMKLTATGKKCFGSQADEAFTAMFNYTEGVNEQYCFNMPFEQAADGKFEFESDYYQSPGATVPGGFYPAEKSPAADMMMSPALPAAENKRKAEGPVYFCADDPNAGSSTPLGLRTIHSTEGVPMSDLMCNGPGWDGGVDCSGYFASGSEFEIGKSTIATQISRKLGVTWGGDGWAWSCDYMGAPDGWPRYAEGSETPSTANGNTYRWTSGKSDSEVLTTAGRNQHFCFESHANFRFKKGLKFSFRGDDDIWVFIDNKLAVDLGGTHLAAPGYVDLDKFMPSAEVGKSYDIDIYFCDRRTTMSNVHIKTNMFIEQTTGITTEGKQDIQSFIVNGDNIYKLCYKKSGGGSCSAAMGGGGEKTLCGEELKDVPITYIFSTDKSGQDPTKTKYSADQFAADPKPYDGGIDVSTSYAPIVNEDKLKAALPSGKYFLIIKIGNDQKAIEINIKGSLAVANREAVTVDENGNHSLPYLFKSQAMASQLKEDGTPDIDQMIPLYVAPMIDPCSNAADCKDPLEMQMAPGSEYSLQVDNSKAQFYAMKNGKLTAFSPAAKRTVGDGGIDTIYVTIPFDEMDVNAVETVHVNVNGSSRKAEIKFFVPRLVFVDSETTFKVVTGDKDSDPVRMKGSAYDFYIVALNGDDSPCTDCNFKLTQGSKTSDGVRIIAGGEVVNGRAKVTIQSSKEYCRESEGPGCKGTATLHVVGPSAALMQATYVNMQFTEPPVPYPLFADIFDVHGAKSETDINVPTPYYSADKEYLDGIGDSVVVYYHREFHKDSLPDKVAVFWENSKDSVLFEHAEVVSGAACGTAKGAKTDSTCIPKITLGGKQLSKDIKTSGTGTLKSWATYSARGVTVTSEYSSVLLDRIAPIIISARAVTDTAAGKNAQLRINFSEPVQKTDLGEQQGDNVFSFYINAGKEHHFVEFIPVLAGVSYGNKLDSVQTIFYSQATEFPQAGDYIHFRGMNATGLVMDQSTYKSVTDSMPGAETLRPADEYNWNIAPAYDSDPSVRVPSPWALITGAVNAYAVRLIPDAIGSIPLTPSEYAKLPDIEAFTFDAYKDESDFKKAMINKDASVDPNLANYGFVPHGWFIKSDMSALIVQDTTTQAAIGNNYASVFFNYELQFFTNLGSHVVTKKGRIYCDDAMNQKENGKYFFEGKNCVDKPKNFFIVWNMKSDKQRLVGSGAYVAKLKTYVQLANFGKKNKNDKTQMWGVRHNTKVLGNLNIEKSN